VADGAIERALGIDGANESVLYVAGVGMPKSIRARRARRARFARREASVRARHAGTQVAKSRASWLAPGCGPELSEIPP